MAAPAAGPLPATASTGLAVDARSLASLKASAGRAPEQALKQAAREFEALFLNQVLKSMRESLPRDGPFASPANDTYTQMLDRELSRSMASKGTGLAALIEKQLGAATAAGARAGAAPAASSPESVKSALESARRLMAREPAAAAATAGNETAKAPRESQRSFLDRVAEMARAPAAAVGLSPVFVAAQAALESGWGRREIRAADGTSAHNLFSLKAGANWKGPTVEVATTEFEGGVPVRKVEKFRAYGSYAEGLADYVKLLATSGRYREALASGQDAPAFARAIGRSGYATDPAYGRKLAAVIEQARRTTAQG